ncbi:unnamed protein product [marine sediment metagenome]|uniref:Ribosomal protein L29 n=1 Tax=marine sediment metagenome TaxID=412755 RepID=X1ECB1_9ZZZZ
MKINDLRNLTAKELLDLKTDLNRQVMKAQVTKGQASKKVSKRYNYKIFKEIRKTIARINTILNAK